MSAPNDGGQVLILLKGGGTAMVSFSDFEKVATDQWRLGTSGYVYRVGGRKAGVPCLLHRVVMGAKVGVDVHHKNEDKTDCSRENLLVVSPREHQAHHSHLVSARNKASRIYPLTAICKSCGMMFTKNPDHRGRQTCCSKRCACLTAVAARKEAIHVA